MNCVLGGGSKAGHWLTLIALLLVCSCSSETADSETSLGEDVDTLDQALGEASCLTARADKTFWGGAYEFNTPETYNNGSCYNGFVIDINNYSPAFTGKGNVSDGQTHLRGAYAPTKSRCNRSWLSVVLYEKVGKAWVELSRIQTTGKWEELGGGLAGSCSAPALSFSDLEAGKSYRFAASARPYVGAPTTQSFFISSIASKSL